MSQLIERIKNRIARESYKLSHSWDISKYYLDSLHKGYNNKHLFEQVETFCLFIGYPRSGHSLVGSLIDAHPNAIISHELDILSLLNSGFNKYQLFYSILSNSAQFTQEGREWTGYSYFVPNQWQGKFTEIKVIGDKSGNRTTRLIDRNQLILKDFIQNINVNLKFIHVIRNPFDNISTMFLRGPKYGKYHCLEHHIKLYFELCEINQEFKQKMGSNKVLDVRNDELIEKPEITIRNIYEFLGLSAEENLIKDCSSIIFNSPSRSRDKVEWSKKNINFVMNKIQELDFLLPYSYSSI